jgi:3-hydroxymyristoyl/3-hydroxydecanoyl-(acyl carrier protein) dehydratase
MSEDVLAYHCPDAPIMPGMLIVEALVQLADWVIRESTDFQQMGLAIAFERLKFRRLVRPGDQLHLEVEIIARDENQATVKGRASCDGRPVTAANFTLGLQAVDPMLTPEDARRHYRIIHPPSEKAGWLQ